MKRLRHFLTDNDISPEEQRQLLTVAHSLKKNPGRYTNLLRGHSIGLLFQKPSLRTRVSSETACSLLGAHPVLLRGDELHFHRGEVPGDGARVLGGYLSLMLARVHKQTLLEELAEPHALSIVNGLSDSLHPLQALADLLTIRESFNGRLSGRILSYFGDGNNVTHSLLLAGAMAGLHIRVSTPPKFRPDPQFVSQAEALATIQGGSITLIDDPKLAAEGADILYTDVWTSMGDEGEEAERAEALRPYQLTMELLKRGNPGAVALHCLPAHFNEEITREVFESRQSRIIQQAHNRLPATAALFLLLLNREAFIEIAKRS